jgi:hypothetical protein
MSSENMFYLVIISCGLVALLAFAVIISLGSDEKE